MACNKDSAASAAALAKKKLMAKDIAGAKRLASVAQNLYPGLEGLSPLIEVIDVHVAYAKRVCEEVDWYGVLGVEPSADDESIGQQFRKLALVLHPDKNKASYADEAFNIITEAWSLLSDKAKREAYDQRLRRLQAANGIPPMQAGMNGVHVYAGNSSSTRNATPGSFWTECKGCKTYFEYDIIYLNQTLKCSKCRVPFPAVRRPAPPEIGRKSVKPVSFQHPPTHPSSASSVPSNVGGNLIPTGKTGTSGLSSDGSIGAKMFHVGLTKNPSGPANSSFQPSFGSSGSGSTGDENSLLALESGTTDFSQADMNFQGNSVPVTGTTYAQSNGGERIHASLTVQREGFKSASGSATSFQPEYYFPKVSCNIKNDISKKPNEEVSTGRAELTKERRAGESILSTKGRAGMENKKVSGSRDVRRENQLINMKNVLGTDRILVNCSSNSKNIGNLSRMQLRSLLLQKAKSDLQKNLNKWSMAAPLLPRPKINVKKRDSTAIAKGSDATSVKKAKKVNEVIKSIGSHQAQSSSVATTCENIDTKTIDYVTMDVPDPDFHDFDQRRTEESFSEDQVWALYDDDDGMPRFYALINFVKSVNPFEIQISRLNSKTNTEIGPMEWITSGFTKTSGHFRIGKHVVSNALSSFSHMAKSRRGPKGVIQIFPGKGETWALYRNWSSSWNKFTPEEEIHQYDIVLVLGDYDEKKGVLVAPLVKVAGFRSVFRQHDDNIRIQTIQKEELFRFSHQIPSYTLTGAEAQNAPKGCMELDPAAMPSELLQVIQENVVQEDGNSDSIGKSDEYYRNRLNRLTFTYSIGKKKRHACHSENGEEGQVP